MVPVQMQVANMPLFILLGDGRVILPGAQVMSFPGPALPALQERRLNEDGIQAVLEAVNTQRVLTLEYVTNAQRHTLEFVTSERLASIAALREERLATIAAMQAERVTIADELEVARVATLKEVDAIRIRTVEASVVGLKDTLDYFLWHAAPVLAVLMLLATVCAVVGYRLTIGRTRRVA